MSASCPEPPIPSSFNLLHAFIRNNIVLNKNFWICMGIYNITFYSAFKIFDDIYYPKLHKRAIKIVSKYATTLQQINESLSKQKHCKSIGKIADNSSRIVSFLHALLGCISSVYFFKKYKRTTNDLINPISIQYHSDELASLSLTCAYFVFDLLVLLRYDRDIGLICHHLAGLSLCAALYESGRGSVGHQWLVFTAEFPTLFLNLAVLCHDTMESVKCMCEQCEVDWNIIVAKNAFIRRLKKIYRVLLILLAISYTYFRCYEWSKRFPKIWINVYKNSDLHPFTKWNWIIGSMSAYTLSMLWSVIVWKNTFKFGIKGNNQLWE